MSNPSAPPAGAGKDTSSVQFPWRLHELLSEAEAKGHADIINWLPGADAFKVTNKQRFTDEVLPKYFSASKYKSFQRNLNLWGFETIQEGPNKGGCFHPLFMRANRDKCHYMNRQKVKGIQFKQGKATGKVPGMVVTKGAPLSSLADLAAQTNNPGMAAVLQDAKKSKLSVEDLKALPFAKKLHHILAQPQYNDCICWTPDGRCIRVVDPFKFQEKVAKNYFSHTSFSSFLVELESFGFKKISHVGFQECFYHDLMIRGCPHLCKYMLDTESSKKFISEDPTKDLEIDQSFGVPMFAPPTPMAPGTIAPHVSGYSMGDAGALIQDIQQRQQFAALQLMAAGGVPGAMGLGLNPALLGGIRPPMPMAVAQGADQQHPSSTPISNYLANSNQSANKATARSEAV